MTPPSLLQIFSRPTKADSAIWAKWLSEDRITDIVSSKVAQRAALYRATHDFTLATATKQPAEEKTFLLMCHSDIPVPSDSDCYYGLPTTSSQLPGGDVSPCAEWEVRNSTLIQEVDPKSLGDKEPPFILLCEIEPHDDEDYDRFYREEHLENLSKVPGYRRSARYRLGKFQRDPPGDVPRYFAVHEWDTLDHLNGPELLYADSTPWARRILGKAKFMDVRGLKFIKGVGYDE